MHYLTLDEVKETEHSILKYIVSVCEQHDLRYYLCHGSLLGAVRHKGFIPWDDDIDISMPRKDYNELINILKRYPSDMYRALSPDISGYPYDYIKVVDLSTTLIEEEIAEYPDMGLWIDIFPLDGVKGNLHINLVSFINKCRAAAAYKTCPRKHTGKYLQWRLCRIVGVDFFKHLAVKLSERFDFDKCEYVACVPIAGKYKYPKQLFQSTTKVEFEGCFYDAPKEYDKYLTIRYKDYMQLPPENQRATHCVKAIRK